MANNLKRNQSVYRVYSLAISLFVKYRTVVFVLTVDQIEIDKTYACNLTSDILT